MTESTFSYRLWEQGQVHLAAGRYQAASAALEGAARAAVRGRDLPLLARVHLPLLEARRLLRYRAVEGRILILPRAAGAGSAVRSFLEQPEGTLIIGGAEVDKRGALALARKVQSAARRSGRCLEALLLFQHGVELRLASSAAAAFADGVAITWTHKSHAAVGSPTDQGLCLPLPVAGTYKGRMGLGALARESLLVAWEALALKWQARHPMPGNAGPWEEILWLQSALVVDPACEPVAMRLLAVAEGLQRRAG